MGQRYSRAMRSLAFPGAIGKGPVLKTQFGFTHGKGGLKTRAYVMQHPRRRAEYPLIIDINGNDLERGCRCAILGTP